MGVNMHGKSDSEGTSIDATTPPRSPARRPMYYVQSPAHSQHELVEKMSYGGSSPSRSPPHNYQYQQQYQYQYHCSPVHHSRESSTSRYSASLKNQTNNSVGWKKFQMLHDMENEDNVENDLNDDDDRGHLRFYVVCFVVCFVLLFTVFSLILWGASLSYKPNILVKSIEFQNFNVQAGSDRTGVPTDMLTLNSTVTMFYRNPATFFGVHVKATPFQLYYYGLNVASGLMEEFYQSRKSHHKVSVVVQGDQVPLYSAMPLLNSGKDQLDGLPVPLNLTFTINSRAYILGNVVKTKFSSRVSCGVTLKGIHMVNKHTFMPLENCIYK